MSEIHRVARWSAVSVIEEHTNAQIEDAKKSLQRTRSLRWRQPKYPC